MSMAGQKALSRAQARREVLTEDVVAGVAAQFQPVYARALRRAEEAEARAIPARILAHTLQRIALDFSLDLGAVRLMARGVLHDLEIPLDLEFEESA